ncbi:MAG TPA: hypothetical protein VFT12_08435 [Thermoanaerobaculia bacterium]|nr:hypothetical protein [Thermoanaerobaculia bacterium]
MALTAAAALVFLAQHRLDVFWTTDGGNRFVQVQQIARTGELTIDYPGRFIDPAFMVAPTGGHHFLVQDNRLHSFYSTTFALLVAPLYRLFGLAGLYIVPVLAMLLTIPLFVRLSRELGVTQWTAVAAIALVFATPLFFYTVSFWEHTLALALTTAAILLSLRERFAFAGALGGLGALFREEGYIALAAVALALVAGRKVRGAIVLAGAAVLVLSPLWISNWMSYGHPLGLHSSVYEALAGHAAGRLSNFWVYLFAFTSRPDVRIAAAVPAILLLLIAPLPATRWVERSRVILLYAAAATAFLSVFALVASPEPFNETFKTQSLFGSLPFAVTFFAVARRLPRFLTIVIAAAIVLTALTLHQGDIGLIWGPRHFLWLIPLLLIAAVESFRLLPRQARPAIVLLDIASVAIHAQGTSLLSRKLRFSAQVLETVAVSDADVVVTDVYWLPEELAALWFEVPILFVKDDAQLDAVIERLQQLGLRRMAYVGAPNFQLVSPAGHRQLLRYAQRVERVGGKRPTIIDVQIVYTLLEKSNGESSENGSDPPSFATVSFDSISSRDMSDVD